MAKIKRHECKTIKEFEKIIRKYIKYFRNRYIYYTYWYTWIWYDAIGEDAVRNLVPYGEKQAQRGYPNLLHIIRTVLDNYNWSFNHRNGQIYYLRGVEISNEDYYFIYVSDTGSLLRNSCVGRFTDVEYYSR